MISEKQKKILAFPYTKYDALICDGAIRSGKTSLMTVAFVDWAMREFNTTSFAICGKTVGSAIKNIVIPYLAMGYSKKYNCRLTRSDNKLIVSIGNKTNTFYIYGGKDESSYMLIQGITLGGVLLDEVALMTRSFVEQALARCSVASSKFWFNCNPENPNHWFYIEWILQAKEHNALHLHFLIDDNPGLDEEIKQRYKSMYTGVFYDRYILGKWVRAEGLIYRKFAENEQSYYIRKADLPHLQYINIGADVGGTKSHHAFVATGVTRNYNKVIVLKAKSIEAKGTDTDDFLREFIAFADAVKQEYSFIDGVYFESAEQTIKNTIINRTDYNVHNSIKNEINERIKCEDLLLKAHALCLVEGECEDLADGLRNAVWDDSKFEDIRLDNGSTNICILDAFEYSFEYYIKLLQRE